MGCSNEFNTSDIIVSLETGLAAEALGINLDQLSINDGLAQAKIGIAQSLNANDIKQMGDFLRELGADKAEIDTGFIANDKLNDFLDRRVRDGKPFHGGSVKASSSKDSDYTIHFDL